MNLKRRVRQAVLPEWLERGNTIADMAVDQTGWTMPWAMWVDNNRLCWLHPEYPVYAAPFGTAKMRLSRRQDGYHVFVSSSMDREWKPRVHHGYVGGDDCNWIPVAQIHCAGG